VGEDRSYGADLAGRFDSPDGRIKALDKKLVHAIIGGKDPDRSPAELSLNLGCGHSSHSSTHHTSALPAHS
jgi:hypothetical protein